MGRWGFALGLMLAGCSTESAAPAGGTTAAEGSDASEDSTTDDEPPPPETTGTTGEGSSESTAAPDEGSSSSSGTSTTTGAVMCEPGEKPGSAGSTDAFPTASGLNINVRTPDDYDPTIGRPLVVVYSPAGAQASTTEPYTGLTPDALDLGWIIAYVDHVSPMSVDIIANAGTVLDDIVDNWCIDTDHIFYTGHSDGGSISEVLLAIDEDGLVPAAAAPSAAGVTGTTLGSIGCPAEPRPVMVIHSANDGLFPPPEFGIGAAEVWAHTCNGCAADPVKEGPCIRWPDCDGDVLTLYCETAGMHGTWTALNDQMFQFFQQI